jgi:hypothetical protein
MAAAGDSSSRFVGFVQVQVASRQFLVPIEARPLTLDDGSTLKAGLCARGPNDFAIVVDRDAPESVVRKTIAEASAEAARRIARRFFN